MTLNQKKMLVKQFILLINFHIEKMLYYRNDLIHFFVDVGLLAIIIGGQDLNSAGVVAIISGQQDLSALLKPCHDADLVKVTLEIKMR